MAGNGIDLAAIYQAIILLGNEQRKMQEVMLGFDAQFAEIRAELATKASQQTLNDYHQAVIGHGIMLTEHDARIATLEQARAQP